MNTKNHQCWRLIVVAIVPIVLLPIFLANDSPLTRWLYVFSIMAVFWITEAIPFAITSLMPIGLLPMLGITSTADVCKFYGHETVFTFLASLIIASSEEAFSLRKRIALKILANVKGYHRRLHFVMMAATMFISMWMLNFYVVAIISEVCMAILEQFEVQGATELYKAKPIKEETGTLSRPSSITKCYLLGISYAATLGGCASLPGTPTNLVFKGIFETYFGSERKIYFLIFFLYSGPIVLLNTFLTWLWLQIVFMGLLRPKSDDAVALLVTEEVAIAIKEKVAQKYIEMGAFNAKEIRIAVIFVMFNLVLISRPYWAVGNVEIENATPMILFVILIFILPSRWNCCKCCNKSSDDNHQDTPFLEWTCVRRKVPWGLIFLLGAGVALASSLKELLINDKIHELIGQNIQLSPLAISFIVCVICQIFTEFLSNTAAANIVMPILAAFCMHKKFEGHAIDVMFPAALSLSMAFHSSIGTPGNAYVADLINIPAKELFYCGIGPTIITLLTCWSTFPTYGNYIYEQIKMPNGTAT
ncbi:protein I'm not dead yet-like [Bradysia coprophila]|uniref:protein I'm not dead yet-like n=1 Tax=Bradysia coprophila TaxID=38358 RepID=UPI00187DC67D|nr:protein I'm not dead yet-like [Bradysia coprophila]